MGLDITWPTASAIVTIVLAILAGALKVFFSKKASSLKDSDIIRLDNLEHDLIILKSEVEHIKETLKTRDHVDDGNLVNSREDTRLLNEKYDKLLNLITEWLLNIKKTV